ncbi:MAG: methyltransferase domain-containing protein [Candidatus Omnitrophica bacterium]|nr:methyltransferase domain-containing protein [Candidatus Omnitrophota bacterium]
MTTLDIVIPVYNEGDGLIAVLESLRQAVTTPLRVLVCYDHEEDISLVALRRYAGATFEIVTVKNQGIGAHGAIVTGLKASTAPAVLVLPADDTYNAGIIDHMVQRLQEGCEIVAASRLMKGGGMVGCPWLKNLLVRAASATLFALARIPTHDATSGFRLFSRRVLERIPIESSLGFAFSLELLVKCHRLGWAIGEVPAQWFERTTGRSRFRLFAWLPTYLRWYGYAFATTYLRRPASTVRIRSPYHGAAHPSVLSEKAVGGASRGLADCGRVQHHLPSAIADGKWQDKAAEVAFFTAQANVARYQALTDRSSAALIERCLRLSGLTAGGRVCDLGCGSGVFTDLLRQHGLQAVGMDLCYPLLAVGQRRFAEVPFVVGDAETLPLRSETLDGLLLSGLIHHLPDPSRLAREAFRVLKPSGAFVAFDPNRQNPFLWLYRDSVSPLYSSKGVTQNERPIMAHQVVQVFSDAGFVVSTDFCSVSYRYVASSVLRWLLPLYNRLEALLFAPPAVRRYRAFVLTAGMKP